MRGVCMSCEKVGIGEQNQPPQTSRLLTRFPKKTACVGVRCGGALQPAPLLLFNLSVRFSQRRERGSRHTLGSSGLRGNSRRVAGSDGAVPSPSTRPQRIHTAAGDCSQGEEQDSAGQFLLWIVLA